MSKGRADTLSLDARLKTSMGQRTVNFSFPLYASTPASKGGDEGSHVEFRARLCLWLAITAAVTSALAVSAVLLPPAFSHQDGASLLIRQDGGGWQGLGQVRKALDQLQQSISGQFPGTIPPSSASPFTHTPAATHASSAFGCTVEEAGGCHERDAATQAAMSLADYPGWVPPLAKCCVQGLPIEALEPELNFRRGYALGYVPDVEDKTHLLPFLRAAHDLTLRSRPRRVLVDLGGKTFDSSVMWFTRMYPLNFTEVHVFEVQPGIFQIPPKAPPFNTQELATAMDSVGHTPNFPNLPLPDWAIDRVHLRETFVDVEDRPTSINITRFIKEELKLTPDDALIIKMDIEGLEWKILPAWLEDPDMPELVDEIFVEIHYHHVTMSGHDWNKFRQTREEALELLLRLRDGGFFVHAWP